MKDTSHLSYRLPLVVCVSGISSWLGSDYASLSGITQKRDSFSLMVKELRILVAGEEGQNEPCGVGLELKISRRTGEEVGGEMCVCVVCVYVVGVCVCCVCMRGCRVCVYVKCPLSAR